MQLRPLSKDDLEEVLSWRNHPDISQWMFSDDNVTFEEHFSWFRRCQNNPFKQLLVLDSGNSIFGFVQFDLSGDLKRPNVEWGFYRSPKSPRGTGRVLLDRALMLAFTELNANKVVGKVLAYNLTSRGMHEKLGFDEEGLLKLHHFIRKEYVDVYCYGLFKPNWIRKS